MQYIHMSKNEYPHWLIKIYKHDLWIVCLGVHNCMLLSYHVQISEWIYIL